MPIDARRRLVLLAAGSLAVAASASTQLLPAVVGLSAGVALLARVRARRVPFALTALLLLLPAAERLHLGVTQARWHEIRPALLRQRSEDATLRAESALRGLRDAAAAAAKLPELGAALGGGRASLPQAFTRLEALASSLPAGTSLAVLTPELRLVAWTGRAADLSPLRAQPLPDAADLLVLEGSVTTQAVALAPVLDGAGRRIGFASAELALAVRRNIHNDYLRDYDLLAGADPLIRVRYVDVRQEPAPSPPEPGQGGLTIPLRSLSGRPLAFVSLRAPELSLRLQELRGSYRPLVSGVALALLLALAFEVHTLPFCFAALLLARLVVLSLGAPLPDAASALVSPAAYASELPGFGPLLRSPLDALLAGAIALTGAAWLLAWVSARPERRQGPLLVVAGDLASLGVLTIGFGWCFDLVTRSSLDLTSAGLTPREPAALALQASGLLILGAALAGATAVQCVAGPAGRSAAHPARLLAWLLLGLAAARLWPRQELGLPLLPALLLLSTAAAAGATRAAWRAALRASGAGARVLAALAALCAIAALLHPTLVHYDDKALRAQIEDQEAPLVLRQPDWRERALTEAARRIDELGLLDRVPAGPQAPQLEELAFATWSSTDLAALGVSSAVEIQDAAGRVGSRFALNLPALGASRRSLPRSAEWEISRERVTVASAERPVLHARRLLVSDSVVHGGVHLYVADDFWNLPFLAGRDPYSVLYRRTPGDLGRRRPLDLVVWNERLGLVFASSERPPTLDRELARRVRDGERGVWATLPLDAAAHHVYLFSDGTLIFGLGYPRLGAGRFLADTLETVLSFMLLALEALALVVLARTALGRRSLTLAAFVRAVRGRFTLRLFAAFLAVAALPVIVLQGLVGRFVGERLRAGADAQALELAAVARKAIEDFALFQSDEAPGEQPVTDDALVWVASLIRNDLDVFDEGRLAASSKRDLYASGLLPPRVSGPVYRALAFEGRPAVLRTETIGAFSYRAVSVPVRLGPGGPQILSIPLALREREVESAVQGLTRTIRLTAVFFLGLAAALAHSIARRISGPVRALTEATRRVAGGDLDARVRPETRDELSELVLSFNQMSQELQKQRVELERSNRLAAWAEMARQVAHEVKNPLTPIQLSAEHLRRVFAQGGSDFRATLEACTATILGQVAKLREISTEFSAFARPPAPADEPVDVAPLLRELAAAYAATPPDVTLALEVPEAPLPLRGERRLIERAVVNLIENALQAVGDSGRVVIRALAQAASLRLEVEDDGPGLEPAALARAFEPFFSTKAGGSGLGLALVKKIVEDHGGRVWLEPLGPRGTRAVVELPLAASPSVATPA
ncbi:MAG: ATP-binding protein [Vicinamibacteria bacterium]